MADQLTSETRRAIAKARDVCAALGRELEGFAFRELAALLHEVDRPREGVLQQWATLRDDIQRQLRNVWPEDKDRPIVEHVGTLSKVTAASTTTWEGERLAYTVAARVADEAVVVDVATGEMTTKPPGVIAHEVARALIACAGLDAGSKQWRKGALRERGINPDIYSDRRGGRPSVRIE